MIDTHVHLWNPQRLRYAWLDDLPKLNRPFLPENLAAATAGTNVTKMIVVECGCAAAQALAEVDWISMLARTEPRICGVVAHASLEQGEAGRADLEELAARPLIKGIRRPLQGETGAGVCLQPEFVAGVRMLADFNFTFDLCIRHEQLVAVTELASRIPEVQFVLDHCGKPPIKAGEIEPWATNLLALAKLPNVVCKISGLTTEADCRNWSAEHLRPYFETTLAAFGFDRVLFGSDWPVSTLATRYGRWLQTVEILTSQANDGERAKLFRTNAERIYHV